MNKKPKLKTLQSVITLSFFCKFNLKKIFELLQNQV